MRPLAGVLLCTAAVMLAACGGNDGAAGTATSADGSAQGGQAQVTSETLADGQQSEALKVNLRGPLEVSFRKVTIPPGGTTGRHCHHGNLIAVVEQGELTHHAPTHKGGVHVYKAGESVFEGADYVHEGENKGDENVVLLVTYVTPKGEPPAETDLKRCDLGA